MLKNAKHEAVAQAFLKDPERVGWRAYQAVYKGSTPAAARTAWTRLLKNADFSARIAELSAAAADSTVMDLREVLAELSKLGRANMQDYVAVDGDNATEVIASLRELPREHAAAIQEITVETYIDGAGDDAREVKRVKLKLHDKRGALCELRKHHEPLRHEHTGKDGKPIEVEEVVSELELARRIAFLLTAPDAAKG